VDIGAGRVVDLSTSLLQVKLGRELDEHSLGVNGG
jgi:hypothetical protein